MMIRVLSKLMADLIINLSTAALSITIFYLL